MSGQPYFTRYFILLVAALAGPAHAQGTCSPPALGAPCATGGVAAAGQTEPGFNLGVGNPIHLATGNKYQQETDLPAHPQFPGLELVRHYNALDRRASILGQGWSLSYDTRLFHAGGTWQIVQADGSRIQYAGLQGKPVANAYGTLTAHGHEWIWSWPNGRKLRFNAQGFLTHITATDGTALRLIRKQQDGPLNHSLERIQSDQGGQLQFSYRVHAGQAYLDRVSTPLGQFDYVYESAGTHADPAHSQLRLTGVIRPDGMQKQYLYEARLQSGNPYALTGITIGSANKSVWQRMRTWAYDSQSRAILSIAGPPDSQAGKLHLSYPRQAGINQSGLTIVTNASGQTTRFHTAVAHDRHVLTQVSGAWCPACPAPGSAAEYDARGRLMHINGTRIQRNATGRLTAIYPWAPGWPGLVLHHPEHGLRQSWHSSLTGTEHMLYNPRRLPMQRRFQNGDTHDYQYDAQGRPLTITASHPGALHITRLKWHGNLLRQIQHQHASETRSYDALNRLSQRQVIRSSALPGLSLRYTESFEYDNQHRLVRHHLPEGGSLSYQWGATGRLSTIQWHDARGKTHEVIGSSPGVAGYRYGNGLHLTTQANAQGQTAQLRLGAVRQPALLTLIQHYNQQGLVQQENIAVPSLNHHETWRYAYDTQGRLIGADGQHRPSADAAQAAGLQHHLWQAWYPDGSLAALRHNGQTHKPAITRDTSGLPTRIANHRLHYGPQRRLERVSDQAGRSIARYTHNAYGQRISKVSAGAYTDYFYLHNQLVAERRHATEQTPADNSPFRVSRRYIRAGHTVVGLIIYPDAAQGDARTEPGQLYAVHTDLVGAPRLITDQEQRIRWLASYYPGGTALRVAGDLNLDLRLPGQVFDAETGWHDNILRTYHPWLGQYLEPDPLGPLPGTQALGYAAQQPRRHIDPLGLLLFAFDGTRHSPSTHSNVWKLSQGYLDGPAHYHSGPGNSMYIDWDAVTASQAGQIIENQWQSLLNELSKPGRLTEYTPIDIIGYSRGAALARHFGNLVNQHTRGNLFSYHDSQRGSIAACVDLRFMGLFDTVAQFGLAGSRNANYDLTIAASWQWVAHAVALHERRWAFPLSSAESGGNVIEAPFIGAHSDIGGGVLHTVEPAAPEGDLADVALNWMLWQARAANLRFDLSNPADRLITIPALHDERPALLRSVQDGDRRVIDAHGDTTHNYQDYHPALGHERRNSAESLITRLPDWRSTAGSRVGTVDMTGYALWLQDELGWQAPPG
ncbi:DUF2235 domain-containing protein [Pusillimonas sp. MFBS29]|uniref:phospholipase effector Tle1 domain-containing protein n=1 Tax=Pusillimonas sp. MFBS29 TaxID=2886690 RepID=UPI001D11B387|nr:DUF2235 domain-containing protein [Pusillimonas sp. MFBS29]MCC2596289.1 DUF2235 domain-containing protein [Pusillimonas sp. MFBS29]